MRLTITALVKATGLCSDTLRKYADTGQILHIRDANNWRIFSEQSIEAARQLAGLNKAEPATVDAARVGTNA